MVPLSKAHVQADVGSLLKSVDLAVRDLLAAEADSFGLAVYLWTMRQHHLTLVRGDGLVAYGADLVRRVLVDGQVGRRRDEDIASAALAAAALVGTSALPVEPDEIQVALQRVLVGESKGRQPPFGRPSYAAVLLFSALLFGVERSLLTTALEATARAYEGLIPTGRIFGLGFLCRALKLVEASHPLSVVDRLASDALSSPSIDVEGKLYLVEALLASGSGHDQYASVAEQIISVSPMWSYVMVGAEDVPPLGDRQTSVPISHLYRATLLGVVVQLGQSAQARADARIDATYRGKTLVSTMAFGFMFTLFTIVWGLVLFDMSDDWSRGYAYWILNDYQSMTRYEAAKFMGEIYLLMFLIPSTFATLPAMFFLLVVRKVESDRRMIDMLMRINRGILYLWFPAMVIATAVNVWTSLAQDASRYTITGEQPSTPGRQQAPMVDPSPSPDETPDVDR